MVFRCLGRYGIKPSLAERSIQKAPSYDSAEESYLPNVTDETLQNFETLQLRTAEETEGSLIFLHSNLFYHHYTLN